MATIRRRRGIASKSNPAGKHGSLMQSGYKIFWVAVFPQKGIVTKKDAQVFEKFAKLGFINHTQFGFLFARNDKEKQLAVLESVKGKLSKRYDCYIITDVQFGKCRHETKRVMTNSGNIKFVNSLELCATSKQRAEKITV